MFDNVHDPGKLDGTKEDDEQVFSISHWLKFASLSTLALYGTNSNPCQHTVWLSYYLEKLVLKASNNSNTGKKGYEDGTTIETSHSPPPTSSVVRT